MKELTTIAKLKDIIQIRLHSYKIDIIHLTFVYTSQCDIFISYRNKGDYIEIEFLNMDITKKWHNIITEIVEKIEKQICKS
jgi:hypothetical protein